MKKDLYTISKTGIVFVPDYVVGSFERAGIGLEALSIHANNYISDVIYTPQETRDVFTAAKEKLSANDVKDFMTCNYLINEFLFKSRFSGFEPNSVSNYILSVIEDTVWSNKHIKNYDEAKIDLMNLYNNKKINYNDLLVSGNDENEMFTIKVYNKVVYVIIHDGFTTPISNNDDEFRNQLSIRLLDYMFKSFTEDEVLHTRLFHRFMSLNNRK